MAQNVRFYSGTRAQYDSIVNRNPLALYFCDDTGELFKGDICLSDGIRIVPTRADLPECSCAADGIVYFIRETRNGYMLSPDRTEWLQTIYAPVTDAYIVPESEIYNTVTTVGAVRDIEKKIYERIEEIVAGYSSNVSPIDNTIAIVDADDGGKLIGVSVASGDDNVLTVTDGGLFVPDQTVNVADQANGLVKIGNELSINLATKNSHGAMSQEDKRIVGSIPYVYEARKYDISGTPAGTLVDYRDREIRVMCPTNAEFTKQTVGSTGNPNMYYMTFKAYAPDGAVSFKEGDRGVIVDEMFTFDGPASGVDEFGRKYSVCWLALASFDPGTNTWTYFGKNSTAQKYIGWTYVVEWYDSNGTVIAYDSVKINLSNEECHFTIEPYYITAATQNVDTKIDEATTGAVETANSYTDAKIAEIAEASSYSISEF